jgi:hypothetical protein
MRTTILVLAVLAARTAAAEPVVLAVDGGDVYVDLGARDGVGAGSELELLHEVVAKDPRSGAMLRDHFRIGTLVVTKSGDRLCVAKAPPELIKRVLAGDRVQLATAKRTYVDPWAEQVAAGRPAPAPAPGAPAIDHAELARAAWQDTLGNSPERRIARWTAFLSSDPQSPYRKAVETEIASLKSQIQARDEALARARSESADDREPRIAALAKAVAVPLEDMRSPITLGPIDHAVAGRPIELGFLVRTPTDLEHAWLYVRGAGDAGFKRIELVRDGDAYLRGTVPGDVVHGDHVDWYAEVGSEAGSSPALGSQALPRTIDIERAVGEEPIAQHRSHVDLHVDYVDFDGGLNKGYDQYYQAEADFTYRFIDPIYAVRLGFGTLSGIGGPKDAIDHDMTGHCIEDGVYKCKNVTFSYVYTELEYRLARTVAVMLRPTAGMLTTDDSPDDRSTHRCNGADAEMHCRFDVGLGLRGRLRFGDEQGTNLVIGAGFTKGVGTLLEASYHWLPVQVVPVQLAVQVTDQPVIEDFGVRLIGDVGLKSLSWFYPSVRVSYQARSRDHAGVSGGLAMNFDW